MNRSAIIAAALTIVLMAFGTYRLKGEVKALHQQANAIEREIRAIHAETSLLKAEWAYLSRPERLEALAEKHLPNLQPIQLGQRAEVMDLPVRYAVLRAIEEAEAAAEEEAAADEDGALLQQVAEVVTAPGVPSRRPHYDTSDRLDKFYSAMDEPTRRAMSNYARRALHPASYGGGGR